MPQVRWYIRLVRRAVLVAALLLPVAPAGAVLAPAFRVRVGEPPGPSPPVFGEGRAWLVSAGGSVHALDTTRGRLEWEASVRCGRDAFLFVEGALACATGTKARLAVVAAADGRLLARETLDGGPYVVHPAAGVLVFHDVVRGRLLGYDVARRTWTFDHRTEVDPPVGGAYVPLSLGTKYLYAEEDGRTLSALDVTSGRPHVLARSDTPVRIDRGTAAEVTHGLLLSHTPRAIQAFDIGHSRRAWRLDVARLTGSEQATLSAVRTSGLRVLLLVEVPAPAGTPDDGAVAARWPLLVVVGLRDGRVELVRPLAPALPAAALPRLLLPQADACRAATVVDIALAGERPIVAVASPCDPRLARFPVGVVAGLGAPDAGPEWTTRPATATRLRVGDDAIYGLWGGSGVPHGARTVVELDPRTGAERVRHVVGYEAAWTRLHDGQLWVGTTAGTVVVYHR